MTRRSVQERLIRAHLRQTLLAEGDVVPAAFLLCPNEGRMVEMARCATCGHCSKLFVDEHTLAPFLTCDLPAEHCRWPAGPGAPRVSEALRGEVFCLHPDADLRSCATLFRRLRLDRATVIEDDGAPVGALSRRDLAEAIQQVRASCAHEAAAKRRGRVGEILSGRSVREVMRPGALTVADDTSLGRAAGLILASNQDEVIVVDALGRMVGVLSTRDILRFLAEESPPPSPGRRAPLRAL